MKDIKIYGFGSNYCGQLNLDDETGTTEIPICVNDIDMLRGKNVVKLVCGKMHVLVLCENNELYGWGVNDDHALGSDFSDHDLCRQIPFKYKIVDIYAGTSYSAILTKEGRVYTCGTFKSANGILGYDFNNKFGKMFQLVPELRRIKKLAGNYNHLLCIDSQGSIWGMGDNESLQLGKTESLRNRKYSLFPTLVKSKFKKKFIKVSGGTYHTMAITEDNKVSGWGGNYTGQLGDGTLESTMYKRELELNNIVDVSCSNSHTLFLDGEGTVYGCGDNRDGQLGVKEKKDFIRPIEITKNVCKIRTGNSFSVVQKGNELFATGCNVEKQCGVKQPSSLYEFTRINFDFGEIIDFSVGGSFVIVIFKK
ncbi:RCC1 [Hepatospora eriocheir]|uniref:RCC1 n=1 Tax=Hepatospora eriocheir TaxID=1081669 RepID=A0A1X0QHR6_9MICR|nr:RCC1 [Hepatospora eriocheir]